MQENIQDFKELRSGAALCGGKYTILRKIGEGGFGVTYQATQNKLNRSVCIKEYFLAGRCLRNTNTNNILFQNGDIDIFEKYRQAFVHEAETVASLHHPNIVEVIDIFDENNTSYMVMPFIEGQTLESLVEKNGPLSYADATNYMSQIADAVDYIHQRNILHRDIKPGNIMITADYRAILIDFGSAREFVNDKTQAHTSILTHGYAPPEQYSTVSRKGAYSDIYSLGATLYYVLTGKAPVDAAARITEALPEPRQLNPSIPLAANNAIIKAMQLQTQQRQQSVAEFVSDLQSNNISGRTTPSPTQPWVPEPQPKPAPRRWWIPVVIVLLIIIVVLGVALSNNSDSGSSRKRKSKVDNSTKEVEKQPEGVVYEPTPRFSFPNDSLARAAIQRFTVANVNNDFATVARSYAPFVKKYHKAKNITRDSVMTHYRKYDDMFGVYSKSSDIRWNTFTVTPINSDSARVTYVEDYHIDREDRSLPMYYVLEKHLVIDANYQIISIYDKHLEKY